MRRKGNYYPGADDRHVGPGPRHGVQDAELLDPDPEMRVHPKDREGKAYSYDAYLDHYGSEKAATKAWEEARPRAPGKGLSLIHI